MCLWRTGPLLHGDKRGKAAVEGLSSFPSFLPEGEGSCMKDGLSSFLLSFLSSFLPEGEGSCMKDCLSSFLPSFLPGSVDTLTAKEPAPQSTPQNERLVSLAGRQDGKSLVFGKTDQAWIAGHRCHLDCSLFHPRYVW